MKVLFVLCIVLAVSCSAFGATENQVVLVRSRRDLMEHSVQLIKDLAANLRKAAEEALQAVSKFTSGLMTEAGHIRDKVYKDIENFRNRISAAVDSVYDRFSNASTSVKACVDAHRTKAGAIFDETMTNTMTCADEHVSEISTMIQELKDLANKAIADATAAMDSMKQCIQADTNVLSTGSCLGVTALQTELKSAAFLGKSAFLVTRINLSIGGLPLNLDVCASSKLLQASVQTGKVVLDIGSCSASAIFNNITGKA